jgi:microcystin-dependent protein
MSSPFIAEITMFAFNFAPTGWAFCSGQLIPISQNTALFSLLGTMYGGDGKSTFALPNLIDSAAVNSGQGPGLSDYAQGQIAGADTETLLSTEMPLHSHGFMATTNQGTVADSTGNQLATAFGGGKQASYTGNYLATSAPQTALKSTAIAMTGASTPHNNMQPYLTLNFCIALQGVFPARP